MVISRQAGFPASADASTLSVTPVPVGDLLICAIFIFSGTSPPVSAVSGGGVSTWTHIIDHADSAHSYLSLWWGIVTATGAHTISFTGGSPGTDTEVVADSYTAPAGATWAVGPSGFTAATGATIAYPSLTPAQAGVYFGYAAPGGGSPSAGSTSGFTYTTTADSNQIAANPAVASRSPVAPTSSQPSGWYNTVAAIFTAAAPAPPAGTPSGGLRVRERPPLRLAVSVQTPNGHINRWGNDDPNVANQPSAMALSSTMPGGFENFSCTLQRDPARSYPDLEELSQVTVSGLGGGQIAWQGRLEDLPDTGGSQAQVTPTCVGYQSHLDDDSSAAMIYVDQQLATWQGAPLNRQIGLAEGNYQLASSSVASDPGSNSPALVLEIDDSWDSPYLPIVECWYDAGVAGLIARLYYLVDFPSSGSDANWQEIALLAADDAAATVEATGNLQSAGPVSGYLTPAVAYRYAVLQHYYSLTPAGTQGAQFKAYWRAAVYGNHGLTGHGPDPVGFLASDVIAHAIGRWAPLISFTTGPDGTIQPSQFVIPQLTFPTPGTASVIVKQAAQYELLDWAVWEGPTFYCNPRGQSQKARNWRARVGECQLQETGPQISRLYNGVVVSFTGVDGSAQTVGPPGSSAITTDPRLLDSDPANPCNQVTVGGAPLRRWAPLSMGTTTPAAAIQVGAIFLAEQKLLDTSGQAALIGHVQDDRGVWWPAWMVRAGDTLAVIDASDPSPRRIVSASYSDDGKVNTVQLDQPPDSMTALLDRLSVVIQPAGFS